MDEKTACEIAALGALTVSQLRDRYQELTGDSTMSRHRAWLVRRIAWHLQARNEGGLSEAALARAAELLPGSVVRLTAPRPPQVRKAPQAVKPELAPGTVLQRAWHGTTFSVVVTREGFLVNGACHASLTAAAKAITGMHWNGRRFFGLGKRGAA